MECKKLVEKTTPGVNRNTFEWTYNSNVNSQSRTHFYKGENVFKPGKKQQKNRIGILGVL